MLGLGFFVVIVHFYLFGCFPQSHLVLLPVRTFSRGLRGIRAGLRLNRSDSAEDGEGLQREQGLPARPLAGEPRCHTHVRTCTSSTQERGAPPPRSVLVTLVKIPPHPRPEHLTIISGQANWQAGERVKNIFLSQIPII